MRKRVTARMRAEEGVALIVTMGALSVMLILSALAFSSSTTLSGNTNRERSAKKAFQAAEAGLEVGTYRVNNLVDVTGVATSCRFPGEAGCADSGTLADGSTWSYALTPELTPSTLLSLLPNGQCAGFPVGFTSTGQLNVAPRCLTATGTSNGVTRRQQIRLSLFKGAPLFAGVPGMVGRRGIRLKNASKIHGRIGSNGLISLDNSNEIYGGIVTGPGAPTPQIGNSTVVGGVTSRPPEEGPIVFAPVQIGNTATVNNNAGMVLSNRATRTYDAQYREIEFNNGTVTFLGGDYNLCSLYANNSTNFVVPQGAQVRLFIDSPDRPGSGCRAGTGWFEARNSLNISGADNAFQLYIWGGNPSPTKPAFYIKNAGELHMAIHAPNADVIINNAARFYGAINADYVEFKNTTDFYYSSLLDSLGADLSTLFQRSQWTQCRSTPTNAGDPHSGC
jgi:hypothetical protein